MLVVSYTTVSSLPLLLTAVYFLWHLSRGSLRMVVNHHLTLWSPDFPRYFRNAMIQTTLQLDKDTEDIFIQEMLTFRYLKHH